MSDSPNSCSYLADCECLHEVATTTSNNLKSHFLDALKNGEIGVLVSVWKEFSDLYEQEAKALSSHITTKLKMKPQYQLAAGRFADQLNSQFSRGPYDNNSDLYTAAACKSEQMTLITTSEQISFYREMGCKPLQTLSEWASDQGN